jgi:cytochrome c-type biogenesis protein CcmH
MTRMMGAAMLVLSLASSAWAVIETYEFSTLELERRYRQLSQEIRCPKCQNQNIADSNAPIARDLRVVLHEQLEAGRSDEEILAYMVDRYGEFVRYRPVVDRQTFLLWWSPVVLLVLGVMVLVWQLRRRKSDAGTELDPDEQQQLDALLRRSR